jgi:hypothetical protein
MSINLTRKKEMFRQRDVRETPTSTATATATGLTNKTSYVSVEVQGFGIEDSSDYAEYDCTGNYLKAMVTSPTNQFYLRVNLPQGAIITGAKIFGTANAGNNVWALIRSDRAGTKLTLANNDIGTASTGLSEGVANETYSYYFECYLTTTNDRCYGGYVSYTTYYD